MTYHYSSTWGIQSVMRPLNDEETHLVFDKLAKYLGDNLSRLMDGEHYLRLHKERVYYLNGNILKHLSPIANKNLISAGVCIGKFTKTRQFKLTITSIQLLAQYSINKIWLKSGDQSFIYGNHVLKRHIGRCSRSIPANSGVVIFTEINNLPIGFGVTSKSSDSLEKSNPEDIAVFHQADIGEYLRHESDII